MEIRLLGVVEATVDGNSVPLRAAKQRAVMAMLALEANATVSTDRLIEGLWGEQAPASAQKLVQHYVSQLRRLLERDEAEIITRGRGYELRVPEESVDVLRFKQLVAAAEPREALALWRGPPLFDLADEPFAAAEIRRLEELSLRARELVIDDALAAGEHRAVLAELQTLVTAQPLRERLRAQLMLALYRSGRQAEALDVYTDARRALVEGLGIEPGRELRDLQAAILAHDPALDGATERLPVGTVTFLLTDIEGSTRLWESAGDAMAEAVSRHYEILDAAMRDQEGVRPVEQGEGDSVVAVFTRARDALLAALEAQRMLHAEAWPDGAALRVRMALHTGDAKLRDEGNYFGPAVIRCARLRALAHGGQVLLSRATCDLVHGRLPEEATLVDLGEHRLRDLGRPEHVFALSHPDLPTVLKPLHSLDAPEHNLPHDVTSFVGRDRELVELRDELLATRLLTLTGAGGSGKTRLAIEAARRSAPRFADSARFVALAPLSHADELPVAIAAALALHLEGAEPPTVTLRRFLSDRSLLLVLDNFEHLLAGAPLVAELLAACPRLTVLATSREPLRLAAERVFEVGPLPVDDEGSAAVELFCERARARSPGFVMNAESAPHVREICRRLDGLPLALELAAAHTALLSPAELLARLNLALLAGGASDAPERQRTLRATIDSSYAPLDEKRRSAFRRMAVFAGPVSIEAALAVTGADVPTLEALLDRRLLLRRDDRVGMLVTIREFAAEHLTESGEADATHLRHAEFWRDFAEQAARGFESADWADWRTRALDAMSDLRAALAWTIAHGRNDVALRTAAALRGLWEFSSQHQEAWQWLTEALAADQGRADSRVRAAALWARSMFPSVSLEQAERDAADALELYAQVGDRAGMALCRAAAVAPHVYRGDFRTAMVLAAQAVELADVGRRRHRDDVGAVVQRSRCRGLRRRPTAAGRVARARPQNRRHLARGPAAARDGVHRDVRRALRRCADAPCRGAAVGTSRAGPPLRRGHSRQRGDRFDPRRRLQRRGGRRHRAAHRGAALARSLDELRVADRRGARCQT